MDYEILEAQDAPGEWRVEAINHEGEIYGVIFLGPDARKRAEDYATWKSAQSTATWCVSESKLE